MIEQTPQELITEAIMSVKARPRTALLILEGDSDLRLFRQLPRAQQEFLFIVAGNADAVIEITSILDGNEKLRADLPPFRAIVDRDYRDPLGRSVHSPSILTTDFRDIECMMIASNAFDAVMDQFASGTKLRKHKLTPTKLRSLVVGIARPIGELRFWSQASGLNASFKCFDVVKCLDMAPVRLNEAKTIVHLNGSQENGAHLPKDAFKKAKHATLVQRNYFTDDLLLCRGHDLMALLAALLRKVYGRTDAALLRDGSILEKFFGLSFPAHWSEFKLLKDLHEWMRSVGYSESLN